MLVVHSGFIAEACFAQRWREQGWSQWQAKYMPALLATQGVVHEAVEDCKKGRMRPMGAPRGSPSCEAVCSGRALLPARMWQHCVLLLSARLCYYTYV